MRKLDNRVAYLRKYVGKTFTPQTNGLFTIDAYHDVKIVLISARCGVDYVYVHKPKTKCYSRRCRLVGMHFNQSVTSFFSHVDWREGGKDCAKTR